MVGQVKLNTIVNGRPITGSQLRDPFDLRLFPGAVDISRNRSLQKLGKDISFVTKQIASQNPDVLDINVSYKVENGDLIITTFEETKAPYDYLSYEAALSGEFNAPQPKMHVLRATMAVLHQKNQPYLNSHDIAYDIIGQWRGMRGSGSSTKGAGPLLSLGEGVAGVAYGLSLWGGHLVR
jgi:hypothetical protein